jgi:hypothetical protein
VSDARKIRFGFWYDFRNPAQWRQPYDRLYDEILDQIAWAENNGFDEWVQPHLELFASKVIPAIR